MSFTNHAELSADLFTAPESVESALLTSVTVPLTGAYTSDAALTDSTVANDALRAGGWGGDG